MKRPDLMQWLDIVALGTVCDVVPLRDANRAFVAQGLKVLGQGRNTGLAALLDVAQLHALPKAHHFGFVLGPRINAGGRVGNAGLGVRLLTTSNPAEARRIAQDLDQFNAERQALEADVLEEALRQVEDDIQRRGDTPPFIIASGIGWHPGVIGIVASRLKERYARPSAVIALDAEDGTGKASARSISGVDLGQAVTAAREAELLISGGGHAMAAGFTVESGRIQELYDFLLAHMHAALTERLAAQPLYIDADLSVAGVNVALAEHLAHAEPYGVANPKPRFALRDICVVKADRVGKNHLRCIVRDNAVVRDGKSLKAMAFRAIDTPLGDLLLNGVGRNLHLAGAISLNHWNGNTSAEFTIEDAMEG